MGRIFCSSCGVGLTLILKVEHCPLCGKPANWRETSPFPRYAWHVTVKDWHFLKTNKIDPQQEEPQFPALRR